MNPFINVRTIVLVICGLTIIAAADVSSALFIAHILKISIKSGSDSSYFIEVLSHGYLKNTEFDYMLLMLGILFFIGARLGVMRKAAELTYKKIYTINVLISSELLNKYCGNFHAAMLASTPGLITKKLHTDVNLILGGVLMPLCNLIVELIVIFSIVIFLISEVGYAAVIYIAIPFGILVLLVASWFRSEALRLGRIRDVEEERKMSVLVNLEKSVIDVVVYKSQKFAISLFSQINEKLAAISSKQNTDFLLSKISFESIFFLCIVAFVISPFFMGASTLEQQKESNESIVGLISVVAIRLLPGFSRLIQLSQTIAYAWPTARMWFEHSRVTDEAPICLKFDDLEKVANTAKSNEWILRWPSFSIHRGKEFLMLGSSLELRQGEFISIFGNSGSGKTSLLTAIFQHLESQHQTKDQVAWIRQTIGFISQDAIENVTLSPRENTNRDKLIQSLLMAGFDNSFLERLEKGASRSDQFSGGQIQRLNLARAFYHGAKILLLDEFTSALDSSTELQIYQSLNAIKRHGVSVIFVSHRESVKQFSDRIYSINNHVFKQIDLDSYKK